MIRSSKGWADGSAALFAAVSGTRLTRVTHPDDSGSQDVGDLASLRAASTRGGPIGPSAERRGPRADEAAAREQVEAKPRPPAEAGICGAITKKGTPCQRKVKDGAG